jgi:manganese/zinc/iron transport system substrate-binding protein
MVDNLVKQIAGEEADTLVLIGGDLDPHSYEPVKGDQEKFLRADIIFYNGLGLEHGPSLEKFLQTSSKAHSLGKYIEGAYPERILYLDGVKDPHIWMDLSLFSKAIPVIVTTLSEKMPDKAALFQERGLALEEKLEKEHLGHKQRFSGLQDEQRYLVTSHDAFGYFTYAYIAPESSKSGENWRVRCQAPEGLAPEGQLSAADIRHIVEHLKKYGIRVIFPESNVNKDAIRKIADVCKDEGFAVHIVAEPLYGDSMGNGSYSDMIHHNVDVISRNLNKNGK